MNALLDALVPAVGWALVDFLWQGALLGLLVFPALALLRDARPQLRYAVLLAALAACLALPALGALRALLVTTAPSTGAADALGMFRFDAGSAGGGHDWRQAVQPNLPQLVTAWSLGAALLALRFAFGLAWVGRWRMQGRLPGFDWQARLERVAAAVGLAQAPELRLVEGLEGPAVAGWWRPVVLMPAALLARMPADLVEALLAHELAHVRRHDYLVNLLQGVVEALLFYHPVVWWLSRRLRIERELIADDLALRSVGEPRRLALALQRLDQLQAEAACERGPGLPHLAPAAHGGQLMNRIRRLIRPQKTGLHWKSGLPAIAAGALCLALYAQAHPVAEAAAQGSAPSAPASTKAPVEPAPTRASSAERRSSYAIVGEGRDDMMMSGSTDDTAAVRQARQKIRGDFLWFRRDGAEYVVRDPAVLESMRRAWAPAEEAGAELEAVADRMKPHSARMEQLGKQMEALSAPDGPQRDRMQALSERMEPLGEQQREIGEQMRRLGDRMPAANEAEREQLSRQMDALSQRMAPLNAQMSRLADEMSAQAEQLRATHEPMQRLGDQMREAGEPMRELSEEMRVLGERQESLVRRADAQAQALIDQALRDGKAERSRPDAAR